MIRSPHLRSLALVVTLAITVLAPGSLPQAGDYGAAIPVGEPASLASVLGQPLAEPASPALYRGRVVQVCQQKGCWMMLEDGGQAVRVMMHGHAFSLPKDASGTAVVYGSLTRTSVDAASAAHLAADAGDQQPVATVEYRIDALGVRLLNDGELGGGD